MFCSFQLSVDEVEMQFTTNLVLCLAGSSLEIDSIDGGYLFQSLCYPMSFKLYS
jgi:hypothetical protein